MKTMVISFSIHIVGHLIWDDSHDTSTIVGFMIVMASIQCGGVWSAKWNTDVDVEQITIVFIIFWSTKLMLPVDGNRGVFERFVPVNIKVAWVIVTVVTICFIATDVETTQNGVRPV